MSSNISRLRIFTPLNIINRPLVYKLIHLCSNVFFIIMVPTGYDNKCASLHEYLAPPFLKVEHHYVSHQ